MTLQHKFERFLRHTLSWKLHLSPSKQVALEKKFQHFSDIVKPLAEKAPEEFDAFFNAFKSKFDEIEKWKTPKGYTVVPTVLKDKDGNKKLGKFPNGKVKHQIAKKKVAT